jgi:protein-L-isoaspartate(D-aspartate) O-methyltransferase
MREARDQWAERRRRMVDEQMLRRGLDDPEVLAAMRAVPRHLFVPEHLAAAAYEDTPLPIGWEQTISQPYMVALMTHLARVDARSRVLDVGAGSGYQSAVLDEIGARVFAVERLAGLEEQARERLHRLGYQVRIVLADGSRGWPEHAPYDAIVVGAAALEAPQALLDQLAPRGHLVIPLGEAHRDQVLTVFRREGDEYPVEESVPCRFVPLVGDHAGGRRGKRSSEPVGGERAQADVRAAPVGRPAQKGEAMKSVSVTVSGRVQGVYYRATAQQEARHLGLSGWVRNLSEGSVALHLQGDPAAVDAMLDWCRIGPPGAEVGWVQVDEADPDESLSGFAVR